MLFSSPKFARISALVAVTASAILLSGCSFTPVYSDSNQQVRLELDYAKPNDRLEQIIYQDLAFRLGKNTSATTPDISIAISTSSRRVGLTTGSIQTPYEMVATATVTIRDGSDPTKVLTKFVRTAAASFEKTEQELSNQAAKNDAKERVAHTLAEMIRAKLLADLA